VTCRSTPLWLRTVIFAFGTGAPDWSTMNPEIFPKSDWAKVVLRLAARSRVEKHTTSTCARTRRDQTRMGTPPYKPETCSVYFWADTEGPRPACAEVGQPVRAETR